MRSVFSPRRILPVLQVIFCLILLSCSHESPLVVPSGQTPDGQSSGHGLMGMYQVYIDLATLETSVLQIRTADSHFDVTKFLKPPYCADCFKIKVTHLDQVDHKLTADVTIKNFTKKLTGYDVRGIVYPVGDYILENAYAYTLLFAPPDLLDPSGFRAFDTSDPSRAMLPGESATETFVIGFPPGATFVDLVYVIDASYPDHCSEAYNISDFQQTPLSMVAGSEAQISVVVSDWQNDTKVVTIATDNLGGEEVTLTHGAGDLWSGTIENVFGIPPGDYDCWITARDKQAVIDLDQKVSIKIINPNDQQPPTWLSDVGITAVEPGLTGMLVSFGVATDPAIPVTYNLYWIEGNTLDFDTAHKVTGIANTPYLLSSVKPGPYALAIRAEDAFKNETTNTNMLNATVGEHPNIRWIQGPSMQTPRGYSGGFIENGHFWVLGGYSGGLALDVVERYAIAGNKWTSPWTLPEALDSFGCGTSGGKAYIFGGRTAETKATDACRIVDLATGNLDPSPPTLPFARANVGCAILDGVFYITGGRAFTGSQWEFYRQTITYTPPGPDFGDETDLEIDTAMMGFAAGDGYMMTCGGYSERNDVLYHEPGAKSWQFKAGLGQGRESNSAVWDNGWLYSLGGSIIEHATTDVEVYSVAGDKWYVINPLLQSRYGAVAAIDSGKIYIAGGLIEAGPAVVPIGSLEIGQIF